MIIDFIIDKKILTISELWDEVDYLEALELSSENDRAFILVAAVAIEDKIYKILESLLPRISAIKKDRDFTFSFKINLLKSFDFYNPQVAVMADLIRKIRNEFAHNLTILEFERLSEETIQNINQNIRSLETQRTFESVRDKIEAIAKWLIWELTSLEPYAKELREIMDSEETSKRLENLNKPK